jgi:hypothetical protein
MESLPSATNFLITTISARFSQTRLAAVWSGGTLVFLARSFAMPTKATVKETRIRSMTVRRHKERLNRLFEGTSTELPTFDRGG